MGVVIRPKRLYGSVQLSLTGVIEFADIDYSRILGRPLEDMIGRNFTDFLDDRERDAAFARMKLVAETGKAVQVCKAYIGKDFSPTWVSTTAFLSRDPDGRPLGFIAVEEKLSAAGLRRLRASD